VSTCVSDPPAEPAQATLRGSTLLFRRFRGHLRLNFFLKKMMKFFFKQNFFYNFFLKKSQNDDDCVCQKKIPKKK